MTAVPAAIDALLLLLRNAPALAAVRVYDGPWLMEPSEDDVVVIGWLPEDSATVSLREAPRLASSESTFSVQGLAVAWSGDDDMHVVRARVDTTIETIRTTLLLNPSMSGAVSWAILALGSYRQARNAKGCEAVWDFTVNVNAFSRP